MVFRLERVGKEFGGGWLFEGVTAQCNPGDRIGLIGRNGVGKTTLFNLIEGKISPDQGSVVRSSGWTLSRVEQIADLDPERTVYDEALAVNDEVRHLEQAMRLLESRMAQERLDHRVGHEYEELKSRFELRGGYELESSTKRVLQGVGFSSADLDLLCNRLSGGQRSRLILARILLKPADLLLLDEPTNHLDLAAILWLENYLANSSSTFVIVSHDRHFLDSVTNQTWELEGGTLTQYGCAYTRSRRVRQEQIERRWKEFEKQQEWKKETEEFIRRNIVGQKTKQAQARRKQLEKTDWLKVPEISVAEPRLEIPEGPRGGAVVVEIERGRVGFESKCLISELDLTVYRGDRLGILGGNGSGKTTLIRTLLGEMPLLGGTLRWGLNNLPAYFAQEPALEGRAESVLDALAGLHPLASDEELRSYAARFLFRGDDVYKRQEHLSGGERSRLALARLLSRPANVLFLDEPTNHLDIASREALELGLAGYAGTLIVISHDLYFLQQVVNRFLFIKNGRLQELSTLDNLLEQLNDRPPRESPGAVPGVTARKETRTTISKNERMRLEKRMAALESEIEELENRKCRIEADMSSGELDHGALSELSRQYRDLEGRLVRLYPEWEELGNLLEGR